MTTYLKTGSTAAQDSERLKGVREIVTGVIADIRERGDAAVREYSEKFDN
jgi:sulfopropanediol 3-dehydrogenase